MGIYNSSVHRVRPFVEYIRSDFEALERVLDLIGIQGVSIPQEYWYDGEQCREKQLKPNKRRDSK